MVHVCWSCLKWGLVLAVVAAAAAAALVYYRVDDEIRRHVQQQIAQHYPHLKVSVRSAELVEGKGIAIQGLSFIEPGAEGPRAELFYCDEAFLRCATDLRDLLRRQPQVTSVTIRRPTLWVTRRPNGTLSTAKLLPLPSLCDRPPELVIEDGTVEVFDPLRTPSSTLTLRQISGTLSPPDPTSPMPQDRMFRATLSADHLRGAELEGVVDPIALRWTVGGSVDGLDVSAALIDSLPGALAAKLATLRGLKGQGTLSFRLGHDPAAASPWQFDLLGQVVQGRLDHPRLPHALTDLRAAFRVNGEGLSIDELVARSGPAALRVASVRQAGLEPGRSPLSLEAEIHQLELDDALRECLPEPLKTEWQKYDPRGRVNVAMRLHFDGQTWQRDISMECLDVSLSYEKFPYLLEHAKGLVTWKETADGGSLAAHLTAYSGTHEVRLDSELANPGPRWSGWFEATAEQLPIDQKLLSALTPASEELVRSFHPEGTANFRIRTWRDVPEEPLHRRFEIKLGGCSIQYDRFRYPLGSLSGTLAMYDDEWTFRGLEGTNDTGHVTCREGWLTAPERGRRLHLELVATDVPLEKELRDALMPNVQQAWDSLRPRGAVDLLATVDYQPENRDLDISVTAYPQADSSSIEPVHFPYRLERLRGVLIYRDGHVTFSGRNVGERFRAEHGRTILATNGDFDFRDDGSWRLGFRDFSADGVRLDDHELIQALPGRLKTAIIDLDPSGPVDLHGSIALERPVGEDGGLRSGWNLSVVFRPKASIDCGLRLENLSGSLTLAGAADDRRFYSRGELAIDSLTCKDYQLTQVVGPLWIDDRQVLLGSWVDRRRDEETVGSAPPRQPRPITAKFFGGNLYGDGWVTRGTDPGFQLRVVLSQADLSRYAQEVMAGRQNLRGKVAADVTLRGSGRSLNDLGGGGTIELREGDVYELPLMIALLKILSIRLPDQTAFSTSDIDFHILGGHIYFDRINFNGDAISLIGRGQMDFEQSIQLTFYAIVGRGVWNIPLVRELFAGASQQIMQIHAGGTLQKPIIHNEPFPVVGQALQLLQEDNQSGVLPQAGFPPAGQWMPDVGRQSRSRW